MNIVETKTWQLGRFTVCQRPRFDSPGWAQYLVFLGDALIGKSFSMPDLGCCEWLEHQQRSQTMYAYSSAKLSDISSTRRVFSLRLRNFIKNRGRPSKADLAARKAAETEEVT